MTKWIERYRRRAEERYQRLDDVLAEMNRPEMNGPGMSSQTDSPREGTAS